MLSRKTALFASSFFFFLLQKGVADLLANDKSFALPRKQNNNEKGRK